MRQRACRLQVCCRGVRSFISRQAMAGVKRRDAAPVFLHIQCERPFPWRSVDRLTC